MFLPEQLEMPCVCCILDHFLDQTAQLFRVQPIPAQLTVTHRHQHSDSDEARMSLNGVSFALYEDADSRIFAVDEVNEVFLYGMQSRWQTLEFDPI
jgi:hypothetical protein